MKKYQTVHVSIVSRSNLVRKKCRIKPIGDKQQNGNIPPLSKTNPKSQPEHSFTRQLSPTASLRIRNDQSHSTASNTFDDQNISPQNRPKKLKSKTFIIYSGIIFGIFFLLCLTIAIYGLIYITRTTATTRVIITTTVSTVTTTSVTTSSTATTTTTTARPVVAITQEGDPIVGICNTIAGGSTGGSDVNYPATENASNAIDGLTSTKYNNFGNPSAGCSGSSAGGLDTGFYVTPNISNSSIAVALLFATANDNPSRDPITVTLEGTNLTGTAALNAGSSWTLIYNGSTGIDAAVDPGRYTYVPQQTFSNTIAFSSYRLLVTSKRGNNTSTQYSEAQIMEYI